MFYYFFFLSSSIDFRFGNDNYIDVECGGLPSLEHGAIILPELRSSFGAQAMYTCHENYTLIGNENRTCGMDGWSGKQPQCLVDWCPDPIQIAGGHVELSGKRAGAKAIYKCDLGYVLIGDPVRVCEQNRLSTNLFSSCIDVDLRNHNFNFTRLDYNVWPRR